MNAVGGGKSATLTQPWLAASSHVTTTTAHGARAAKSGATHAGRPRSALPPAPGATLAGNGRGGMSGWTALSPTQDLFQGGEVDDVLRHLAQVLESDHVGDGQLHALGGVQKIDLGHLSRQGRLQGGAVDLVVLPPVENL